MSTRIADTLRASGRQDLPRDLQWLQGGPCQGSRHHSPTPLLTRPVWPLEALGHQAAEEEPERPPVYLCATCADNLLVYLALLLAYDGDTPGAVKRDFGNSIRTLGSEVWADHLKRLP